MIMQDPLGALKDKLFGKDKVSPPPPVPVVEVSGHRTAISGATLPPVAAPEPEKKKGFFDFLPSLEV